MSHELEWKPITPDMADDWREHILPALPDTFAVGFDFPKLFHKVQPKIEALPEPPRGNIANAVMAMILEGEVETRASAIRRVV